MADATAFPCPYINSQETRRYLESNFSALLDTIEKCFKHFSQGKSGGVVQPVRGIVPVTKQNGLLLSMPAFSSENKALATKVVTFYPGNSSIGKPAVSGVVLLFDDSNGALKCILDGINITNYRTAGASAVATKYLAPQVVKVLAILGSGAQARSHYKIFTSVYKFDEIRIWNHREETGQKLVQEISNDGVSARYCSSVRDAVNNADVIVTVTSSKTPILEKAWVKPGAHINAVGAPVPEWQELSPELMTSSVIYVDSREGALTESGDIIKSNASIYAEIGEVIIGSHEAYRNKTTIFKSLGMAVEDAVTGELIYKLSREDSKR